MSYHYDLIKAQDWIRIPTEMGPELPDDHISQFSLISILDWLGANKTKDKDSLQQLYNVSHFRSHDSK